MEHEAKLDRTDMTRVRWACGFTL